jgi:hypothetical protein
MTDSQYPIKDLFDAIEEQFGVINNVLQFKNETWLRNHQDFVKWGLAYRGPQRLQVAPGTLDEQYPGPEKPRLWKTFMGQLYLVGKALMEESSLENSRMKKSPAFAAHDFETGADVRKFFRDKFERQTKVFKSRLEEIRDTQELEGALDWFYDDSKARGDRVAGSGALVKEYMDKLDQPCDPDGYEVFQPS